MGDYKALVVDDHMIMRKMIENNLGDFGISECDTAGNGQQAIEKIEQGAYDIVLADWHMPEVSGEELLAYVRGKEALNNVAFIMVTAESEQDNILKIMQNGATAYVVKPFTDEEFKDALEKVMTWLNERR